MITQLYQRYVLAALTLVFTLNYLDRGLIVLLLEPIRKDLQLTDTQLGFLTGIAFGLFYATLGIPIARWADRGNRVSITSIAIALWGLTVMSCLFVTNFLQLVSARIAAAVGEAGCMPPTYSLLGSYFPKPAERTRAMSVYWLATPVSSLFSFLIGGWLNERYGWRMTFFIMGIPALLVAILFKLTVVEPRADPQKERSSPPQLRMSKVLGILWRQPTARHLSIALILLFTLGLGLSPWYAAFMIRSHALSVPDVGFWLGIIFGGGGAIGILGGGHVAAGRFADDEGGQLRLSGVLIACLFPCLGLFLLSGSTPLALLGLALLVTGFNTIFGPAFALMQRLVAEQMRATTIAVVMLLANLIGMGLGPQIVGVLSDLLKPSFGIESLRYAMLLTSFLALWSGYHFWQAGRTVQADVLDGVRSMSP